MEQAMMAKPSKLNLAMRLAKRVGMKMPGDWSWQQARDYLDQATGADLDAWQLDKIVDEAMRVRDRIPRR
jgi:hypothetical protein